LQTAETAGFSLQDIRIFGCHKINL